MGIKFCPKCRSSEIEDITETAHGELMFFPHASPRLYKCTKCGFTNSIFPEVKNKKDLEKVKEEFK